MAETAETGQGPAPMGEGEVLGEVSDLLRGAHLDSDGALTLDESQAAAPAEQQQQQPPPGDSDGEKPTDPLSEVTLEGLGLNSGEGGESSDQQPSPLANLAEKAGVTIEELYETEVGLGSGDTVTLGQLKDSFKSQSELEAQSIAFEDHRTAYENEMVKARGELQEILRLLPELPPELIQQGRARYAEQIDSERQAIIQIKPEWSDPQAWAAAKDQMFSAVEPYGFRRSEMDSVVDHRLVKLIHDFATLKRRVADAQANRKQVLRDAQPDRRPQQRTPARDTTAKPGSTPPPKEGNLDGLTAAVAGILAEANDQ